MRGAGLIIAAAFCVAAEDAAAQGVPVVDSGALMQLAAQLEQQLRDYETQLEQVATLRQQLETQLRQLAEIQAQVRAVTGTRGLSALLNGDLEQAARGAMTKNLNDLVREVGAGNFLYFAEGRIAGGIDPERVAGDLLRTLLLDPGRLADLSRSPNGQDRGTALRAGSGVVLSVAAQDAHGRAEEANARFERLVEAIDEQEDVKGAVDLNTRTTAELGFLLADLVRLEAAGASALGTAALVDARDREASAKFSSFLAVEGSRDDE